MKAPLLAWIRAAWVLVVVAATLLAFLSLPARAAAMEEMLRANQAGLDQLGFSPASIVAYLVGVQIVVILALDMMALLIFTRRPRDWVAMLIAFAFVLQGVDQLLSLGINLNPIQLSQPPGFLGLLFGVLGFVLGVTSLFVFPDGRFVPRWSWIAIPVMLVGAIVWLVLPVLNHASPALPLRIAFEAIFYVLGLADLIYRYQSVANKVQRNQIRWILYSYGILPVIYTTYGLSLALWPLTQPLGPGQILRQLISNTILTLSALLLPLTFAIAIIRYRLWNIDLIINRTLVYLSLTGIVAGLYTATVTLLQRLFILLTGGQSITAYVVATLLIAATFTPMKDTLQKAADRRFKEKPENTRRLEDLTEQVRSVVDVFDVYRITGKLLDEAIGAFGALGGAVYLGAIPDPALLHSQGLWQPEHTALSIPLNVNGRQLGALQLAVRSDGKAYSERDREVLRMAAAEVARAVDLALLRQFD